MDDLLAACESLIPIIESNFDAEPSQTDVDRWQRLFGFTFQTAAHEIQQWRANIGPLTISPEAWALAQPRWEAADGYDKESYEYALANGRRDQAMRPSEPTQETATILVRLGEGPLQDATSVMTLAGLASAPSVYHGEDGDGAETSFCMIDASAKNRILASLSAMKSLFNPTFVRHSKAAKDLSSFSPYPTLGIYATMPQFRPHAGSIYLPTQNQYPVWYFFYGTLAEPEVLARLLALKQSPRYQRANISGGRLGTWAGRYKALLDADSRGTVEGSAYLVESMEDEDALRCYETDRYEVVRCQIKLPDARKRVKGLTFRYKGSL